MPRIAFHAKERVLLFEGHALRGISGQQPAGNEIKPASEEQRHQREQLADNAVLEVVAAIVSFWG